jgi:hypothetical protein
MRDLAAHSGAVLLGRKCGAGVDTPGAPFPCRMILNVPTPVAVLLICVLLLCILHFTAVAPWYHCPMFASQDSSTALCS